MELVIKQDLSKLLPAEIEFNYAELRGQVTAFVEKYKGMLVTPDTIRQSKADCAGLNRLKDAFEEARKREKQKCLAPYAGFEAKVKEIVGIIDEARSAIDSQVKAFEEKRKSEKAEAISAFYSQNGSDIAALVPLARIADPKWLNIGTSDGAWQKALADKIESIRKGLKAVGEVIPEAYRNEAQAKFVETLDFPAVFSFVEERKRQDAILEQRRREEAERKAREEIEIVRPFGQPNETKEPERGEPEREPEAKEETVFAVVLRFHGTKPQLLALRDFMRQNGIWYEKVAETGEAAE